MVNPIKSTNKKVWVWDLSVRMGHWLLAVCFATAYATGEGESWRLWHVYSGNGVLAIVAYRVIWGFIGTPYARFSDFIHHPLHAFFYLKSLLVRKLEHHVGHNPAGGWAVLGLLSLSASTSIFGWIVYQGSIAHWLEQAHELLANLTLTLVAIHVAVVVISSKIHHENLVKTMVVGTKPLAYLLPQARPFARGKVVLGVTLLFTFLFFAGYAVAVWS